MHLISFTKVKIVPEEQSRWRVLCLKDIIEI